MGQPTMEDVAKHAGVSRALVSLVMNDSPRVSESSRQKVRASAAELGYRPNVWARHLASGQTNTVGVMLNDLHNPYFTELAEGVAAAAAESGMEVLIFGLAARIWRGRRDRDAFEHAHRWDRARSRALLGGSL